jgi:hypothetical protein
MAIQNTNINFYFYKLIYKNIYLYRLLKRAIIKTKGGLHFNRIGN